MRTLLLALCLSLAALAGAHAQAIHFVTEEYPPFNYRKDGAIVGISIDQVTAITKAAGVDYTIELMPWARAFALAEHEPLHCAFTATHNKERHARFRWIEPLLEDVTILVRRRDGARADTLDEARKLRTGTQRDDYTVDLLAEKGFRDIDLAADLDITLGKLLSGRIDLMPTSYKTFEKMLHEGHPVEKALVMEGQRYGIACQKDMPEEIATRLQAALDTLILSGGQDRIFAAHGLANPKTAARETRK